MHIGGGANDQKSKAPFVTAVERQFPAFLECFQLTGSFKIRGAFFAMSRLSSDERARGVVTCSAGNHGKAGQFASEHQRELIIGGAVLLAFLLGRRSRSDS